MECRPRDEQVKIEYCNYKYDGIKHGGSLPSFLLNTVMNTKSIGCCFLVKIEFFDMFIIVIIIHELRRNGRQIRL
jgi:hypothetical protein